MSPCGLCLGIGNQVLLFEQFALFDENEIYHFAESYQQKFLGGLFGR
jgi:hypothetical protein